MVDFSGQGYQWESIVAQDMFQRKLNAIFLDIPGVTGIADDMVIYGKTDLEHDRHLIDFLNICRKNTLTLNPDKNAIQVTTGFILWTSVECQGTQSRSKEGCSSQENGFA